MRRKYIRVGSRDRRTGRNVKKTNKKQNKTISACGVQARRVKTHLVLNLVKDVMVSKKDFCWWAEAMKFGASKAVKVLHVLWGAAEETGIV